MTLTVRTRALLVAVALLAAWVLLLALTASPAALLFASPFFMLFGLLVAGRHPGAGLIERVARLASIRRRSTLSSSHCFARVKGFRWSGDDLIAMNLAGRAPPFQRA